MWSLFRFIAGGIVGFCLAALCRAASDADGDDLHPPTRVIKPEDFGG